ncbi:MAG: cystathionine beta-lyase [Gammaproteobacteria bacterium]|nr:cystathionine beta-lyase [Gammaproteobacteria bacterium]
MATVNPPIYRASTVVFECAEDMLDANRGNYKGAVYGTDRLPGQRALEEAICELENGALCRLFQSGISAISHTLMAFLESGDHILVCDNVYGPTARFCHRILPRYNIDVDFVLPTVGSDIERYIKPNTRLIFLESPGSNTFEIQDIPAITGIAKSKDIVTVLDDTWATPLFLKPLDLGVDLSIQSVTKYIAGHSDLLMGAVTVNQARAEEFERYYQWMEIYANADDCYTALRGIKTLLVRLNQHQASGLKVAHWLESQREVERVIYPALSSHPQHHLWKRDFKGASGLFAFLFKPEYAEQEIIHFVNRLKLFDIGYSWGGYKSLITVGQFSRSHSSDYAGKTILRLNIGLEDAEDLIVDLARAMGQMQA